MVRPDSTHLPVRSRAVAAAILAGQGEAARVLVLQRNKTTSRGLWSLVMGRIEKGESAAEAVRREIAEETGLAVEALYSSGCCDTFFNSGANVGRSFWCCCLPTRRSARCWRRRSSRPASEPISREFLTGGRNVGCRW